MMDLTWDDWQQMSDDSRRRNCEDLLNRLPDGFAFDGVVSYSLASQTNEVGLFEFEGAGFVLLPGGQFELGFDLSRWEPRADEIESWEFTAQAYGLESNLIDHLARVTRPPTVAELPTFMIELSVNEVGWTPVSEDEPIVQELVANHDLPKGGGIRAPIGNETIRVLRAMDGSLTCARSTIHTYDDLVAAIAPFRLPTSDEWEYACGARATTLFRWGDHPPRDRYPWPVRGQPDWNLLLQPNAFGLKIAQHPADRELTAEPGWVRGGDGGWSQCAGGGFFISWLPLATSYCDVDFCRPEEPIFPGHTYARRVFELR